MNSVEMGFHRGGTQCLNQPVRVNAWCSGSSEKKSLMKLVEVDGFRFRMRRREEENDGRNDWKWGTFRGQGGNLVQWALHRIYENNPSKD